ncbi:hypothetical protein K7X08_003027 [Anisodus acutangulus]|uniref:Uncharacterized protein n=1 Tax=Anisodus acutangulus TaxID=402998 RepID=A0A9Q1MI06_9SOLA|nr:hypothetical protein K7X08_003027 [Anisodus acutangulus]
MLCSDTQSLLMTAASFFKLPYRLIFAVATLNTLYIYDTESVQPISIVAGLHYAAVTDIACDKCMDIDSGKAEEKTEVKQESTPQISKKDHTNGH